MAQVSVKMPAPPHGVIASLVAGFETVNTRLELIVLPLALDLFLWLGPHLSLRLKLLFDAYARLMAALGVDPAEAGALPPAGDITINLFAILSTVPLGLPSLLAGRASAVTPVGLPTGWDVDSLALSFLLSVTLGLGGLFLGALYFGAIAQQVRDRRVQLTALLRQVWGDWARLTALAAVGLAAFVTLLVLSLPVLLVTSLLTYLNPTMGGLIGGLVGIVLFTLMLWAMFHAAFALHGMFLQRRSFFGALWDSIRLVQVNLPHVAGLFIVIVLINQGLGMLWNIPDDDSWTLLLGVVGHAVISTALVVSTFVFYQDRYRWWVEMRQALRARAEAEQRGARQKG